MGTMTKWPVQKHTEHHKTRSKQGRNRHKEITIFCVFQFKIQTHQNAILIITATFPVDVATYTGNKFFATFPVNNATYTGSVVYDVFSRLRYVPATVRHFP